jgi:esterase/lipase superfamily enzyme
VIDAQAARPAEECGKVHVLAHSLGNRVTLRALAELDAQLPSGNAPFGQIILAAPDVSVAEFEQEVPAAHRLADRVSLDFCPTDEALRASELYHPNEPRAGRGVVPINGLDNIDAWKANTSFLGHGYWAGEKQLLIALQMLVNLGLPPVERVYTLEAAVQPPPPHWRFK